MPRKKFILSSVLAIISGSLGWLGISGLCCTITGAAILSSFGIALLGSYLTFYNKWLFLFSALSALAAIYYYLKYKRGKKCPRRPEK